MADSTNLVHGREEQVFHLTEDGGKFVLDNRDMHRSGTTSAVKKQPGPGARLYAWVHGGWRKVMTGMAAVLALAMAYHVIFGQNGLTVYQKKRQETHSLTQRLHALQHENAIMKGHVDRLENDPNAIEHQAREELHYTRPGEVIYTLPRETAKDVAGQSGATKP
jgi:cell division protein FtsB